MKNDSQQFILIPLLQVFNSYVGGSAFPYLCLLFNMCKTYAETGLFVLVYLVCSLCRTFIDFPVWPTYELLQVLHFSLYIPLEFLLFCGIVSLSCLYIVFVVLVTLCINGL
jgi:hypothetical protein